MKPEHWICVILFILGAIGVVVGTLNENLLVATLGFVVWFLWIFSEVRINRNEIWTLQKEDKE